MCTQACFLAKEIMCTQAFFALRNFTKGNDYDNWPLAFISSYVVQLIDINVSS